jgi:hypothetical protein
VAAGRAVEVGSVRPVRTFLLGTGAQKSGTTWLFHHLKASPQFVSGFRKEYHLFDGLDVPGMSYRVDRAVDEAEDTLDRARRGGPLNAQLLLLASMYADTEVYFDYFASLLGSRPDARLAADVTPAYALLSAQRMTQIKEAFAARGVRTIALFLMRDPVDRIVSSVRMQVREKPERFGRPVHEVLAERYALPEHALRTSYHRTIAQLDRAFGPDEIHFGFYEDLFTAERVREISNLLGVDFHPPKLDERHNASPPAPVPEESLRMVAEHYRDVYAAVAARFPEVDFETLWPGTRFLD